MAIENEFNKPVKGLKIKYPEEVYDSKNHRYKNSKKIYGKVERNTIFAITSKKTGKLEHINDFANLPKSSKSKILQFFDNKENKDRRTLYLVKSDYDKKKTSKKKTTNKTPKQLGVTVNVNLKMDELLGAVTGKTLTSQIETTPKDPKGKKNKTENMGTIGIADRYEMATNGRIIDKQTGEIVGAGSFKTDTEKKETNKGKKEKKNK